jgi:hypothetical protein
MQGNEEKRVRYRLEEISVEEQRNFVGFFELLLKVDKRTNPVIYSLNNKND